MEADIFGISSQTILTMVNISLLAFVVLAVFRGLGVRMPIGRGQKHEAPVISSHQLLSDSHLSSVHKGKMAGFSYNILTNRKNHVMVLVELDHNTKMHLIAIGDKSKLHSAIKAQIRWGYLERIILEGDFPDYFEVYATPSKQMELRQVMEPRNMANFVDFCRAYNVEIFNNSLYISRAGDADDPEDPTPMTGDLHDFLDKNKSMLSRI